MCKRERVSRVCSLTVNSVAWITRWSQCTMRGRSVFLLICNAIEKKSWLPGWLLEVLFADRMDAVETQMQFSLKN